MTHALPALLTLFQKIKSSYKTKEKTCKNSFPLRKSFPKLLFFIMSIFVIMYLIWPELIFILFKINYLYTAFPGIESAKNAVVFSENHDLTPKKGGKI